MYVQQILILTSMGGLVIIGPTRPNEWMQEEEQIGLEATSYLAGIADQLCMYYGGSTIWTANSGQMI